MVLPKTDAGGDVATAAVSDYEKLRLQRIKENLTRMQNMGIFELSRQLHSKPPPKRPRRNPTSDQPKTHNPVPSRRSSRLQNLSPVTYVETKRKVSAEPKRRRVRKSSENVSNPNGGKGRTDDSDSETESDSESGSEMELELDSDSDSDTEVKVRARIPDSGSPPRRSSRLRDVASVSYVEATPEKKEPSESVVRKSSVDDDDGEDGKSIDDGVKDETCHQCRQRTLDDLTHCSKCDSVQGQFSGDCLVMKYGENVIKANQNPEWVFHVCRGICSCGHCLSRKELMHDDTKKEMEEGYVMEKEVNLGSEHDLGKLDAASIACEVDGETKKEAKRSRRTSSAHIAEDDAGKLDAEGGVVDGETNKQPRRSTRTSSAHGAVEDLGNLEAAGDVVDGETKKQPRRSSSSAHVVAEDMDCLHAAGNVDGLIKKQPRRSTRLRSN